MDTLIKSSSQVFEAFSDSSYKVKYIGKGWVHQASNPAFWFEHTKDRVDILTDDFCVVIEQPNEKDEPVLLSIGCCHSGSTLFEASILYLEDIWFAIECFLKYSALIDRHLVLREEGGTDEFDGKASLNSIETLVYSRASIRPVIIS